MPTEPPRSDSDARLASTAASPVAPRGGDLPWSPGVAPVTRALREIALVTGVTAAATLACALLERHVPVASLALVFVCAVLVVAVRASQVAAIWAAALGFLAYNFCFTEPRFSLRISGAQDLVAVLSFLIAALVAGHLAARLRSQVGLLEAANGRIRTLLAAGERLAAAADTAEVFEAGCTRLAETLGCEAVVMVGEDAAGGLRHAASHPPTARLEARDFEAAARAIGRPGPAGHASEADAGADWWFVPLAVASGRQGAVGLKRRAGQARFAPEQRSLAAAMIQQIELAAERTRLVQTLERARVESETERVRTALLASVSHDLRSPLTAVIGSATSLAAYGEKMPAADRRALLESIRSEGERLDRYVQNLLDMTRLGSGPMKLERDWVSLDEILGAALARLRKVHPALAVSAEIAPGLPPLWVHPALVEQALFNILENAAKFSPPGAEVSVAARREGASLVVDVSDRGPGIPEEERRRVFDLFYSTARGDRGARGGGLGLTIVRGMIGAHGGRVEALGGPDGRGTTIRVTLPMAEAPRTAAPGEEA